MAGVDSLEQIKASLIAGIADLQDTDSTKDWFITVGGMLDSALTDAPAKAVADRQVTIYETPGGPPDPSWSVVYPDFQIAVRGKPNDYFAVRNMIEKIWQQLHSNENPLGNQWVYFEAKHSGPIPLGFDEKKRPRLAWNFRSMRNTQPTA